MRKLISLGQDCDVAFQLRMHGEENVAHFFDWLSTPVDGLIKILDADFDVFYPDHLTLDTSATPHHVVDRVTKVRFYHQFPLHNGNVLPNFLICYDNFITKFRFLAQRFRSYIIGGPVTLVRRGVSVVEAERLEDAFFHRFPGADTRFLYIVDGPNHFTTRHGTSRSIKGGSSLGDPIAWWEALQDEGLIESPFHHSTAEILQALPDDHNLGIVDRCSEVQLQTAAALDTDHGRFPLELARFYGRRQRWAKAEEMARLALARSPGLPNAVFELNYISWKAKRISADQAASAFLVFLETEEHDPYWLTEAVAALLEADRFEEAIAYSDKAILATPLNPDTHYYRALCFIKKREFQRAEYAISTALSLRDHPFMRHIHATVLAELGRLDEAIAASKAACKLDSGVFYINHLASLLLSRPQPNGIAAATTVVGPDEHAHKLPGSEPEVEESVTSAFEPTVEPSEDAQAIIVEAPIATYGERHETTAAAGTTSEQDSAPEPTAEPRPNHAREAFQFPFDGDERLWEPVMENESGMSVQPEEEEAVEPPSVPQEVATPPKLLVLSSPDEEGEKDARWETVLSSLRA